MAYTYDQVEYELTSGVDGPLAFTSTGDKLFWAPLFVPHLVRACVLAITTAFTVTPAVVNFTTRPTIGSNSGISAGDIAILNILTSYVAGNVIYKAPINNKKITPGQEVVVNVGTASTAGAGHVSLFCEPSYEQPANLSSMIATT